MSYLLNRSTAEQRSQRIDAAPPLLLVAVQRLDGSFVGDDAFEVELEPDQETVELELTFPTDVPACDFRLAFATDAAGAVSEYTPLEQAPATACEPQPDGQIIEGEDCDDGNLVDGDGCDNNCTTTHCGNGIPTASEACDDGNLVDGDGCEADCSLTPTSPTPTRTATPTPIRTATAQPTITPTAAPTPLETPIVTITASDGTASEVGQDPGEITFTRTGDITFALTVSYIIGGTATNNTDYTSIPTTIQIPAGSAIATRTIAPKNDASVEGDETVFLTLIDGPSYNVDTPSAATVTIQDNPVPIVTVTANDASASEIGPNSGEFTFTRTGDTTFPLTIAYTIGGTAVNGTDYAAIPSAIEIPAGSATSTRTIAPNNDASAEGDESVILTLIDDVNYNPGIPSAATVTITENVVPVVTITANDSAASEVGPNSGEFTFTRTGDTTFGLTVSYTIGGSATNNTDYTSIPATIQIPAGSATATRTIAPKNDAAVEGGETVILTLTDGVSYNPGVPGAATVTIQDNPVPIITIVANDPSASEIGVESGELTVTRTGDTTFALTVTYTIGGSATNGSDYASIPASIQIPAGSATATRTIAPNNDALVEGDQTVTLTLTDDATYDVGVPNVATVTIQDNPTPIVTIVANDPAASEIGPDSGELTVTRTGDTTFALTVTYTIGGSATNGSDYAGIPTSIQIPAGTTTAKRTITPNNDALVEGDQTVILTLTNESNYDVGAPGAATVTIHDNPVPIVTIVASDAAASEVGPDSGELTFTRTGDTTFALTITYTIGGTATNSTDYANIPASIQIPAGSTIGKRTISTNNDGSVEGDETVTLTVLDTTDYNLGAPSAATVTITDNPVPIVTVTPTDGSASEVGQDPGELTFSRTGDTTFALTVSYTVGGTATGSSFGVVGDYTGISTTLVIPAGSATATRTITPVNDALVEGPEDVIVTLTNGVNYDPGVPSAATVTIEDNPVPVVTIVTSDSTASEVGPNPGQFTFTRTGSITFALTVSYSGGGTATNGSDYASIATSVQIPAGSTSTTLTISPNNDGSVEGDETVTLTITDGTNYNVGIPGTATLTIADNPVPIATLAATDATASEAGADTGECTFTRAGDTAFALTVSYTIGGSASNGGDYTGIPTSIQIPAGSATATRTITPRSDASAEGSETVTLTLSDGPNYDLGAATSCTITITD